MMRMPLKVNYVDGTGAEVVASAPDLIAFERHFDKPMTIFTEQVRIEYMLWLTWTALSRHKLTAMDFDSWTELVDGIDFGSGDGVEITPLESSQPIG
ncbi:hypothetical protein UFOVP199_33 [uncultured Caudovirales phage]|uniref:Uncharacterized protein n=1 Tax=uncultured Caudovirales phage TaxID=2100421 RepID=A0A6J7WLC0_9CAUD|nr:hypothetical protein UFOVP199_33 [uncultured Caudovirales phage]